jgi:ribonuclease BN (tRNA processing enzyme)
MPRLYVLGSGGWIPTLARQTCCYLLETRRGLVFFDCGTGVSRLHDPLLKEVLSRHRRAAVLLSHWHHDHVEGLHYLPFFLRSMEVVLGVPAREISGFDPKELLARFGGRPLLPHPLPEWSGRFAGGFQIQELRPGPNIIHGQEVQVMVQPHSDPSMGFRVRDVVYVTDTCDRPETSTFAARSSLLIHDSWLDRQGVPESPEDARWHGTAEGAARLAREAGCQDLLLAHLNPAYDAQRLDRLLFEATAIFPRSALAADMLCLRIAEAGDEVTGAPVPSMAGGDEVLAPTGLPGPANA